MSLIEFETELHGQSSLPLPPEVVERLPKSGRATVVFVIQDDPEDVEWRRSAYEQFLKDDDSEEIINHALPVV
jgi:adenylate kinase